MAAGGARLGNRGGEPDNSRIPVSTIAIGLVKVWIVFWFFLWMFLTPRPGGWVFWVLSAHRVFCRAILWGMWLRLGNWVARSVLAVCAWPYWYEVLMPMVMGLLAVGAVREG